MSCPLYKKLVNGRDIMYQKLLDEKLVIEITNLVNNIDEETDAYLEFMKGVILNTSGIN